MAFDHGNYKWDKKQQEKKFCSIKHQHIPYACLGDRKHYSKASWCQDRKHNISNTARRGYKRTANKHTRQLLYNDMMNELIYINENSNTTSTA